ncbi:hypothetical protein MtrunA17_Chr7g0273971 [Medicago truncatula]|uniref:Uncharacterized protein n=1 Tax=Medicago truncatula TaxID=3880 RepID=A0A396H9K5_MEDTR|nr:hypothetical protein MtrunA17_Chr7g0273971 [Medicago truncatula]
MKKNKLPFVKKKKELTLKFIVLIIVLTEVKQIKEYDEACQRDEGRS